MSMDGSCYLQNIYYFLYLAHRFYILEYLKVFDCNFNCAFENNVNVRSSFSSGLNIPSVGVGSGMSRGACIEFLMSIMF